MHVRLAIAVLVVAVLCCTINAQLPQLAQQFIANSTMISGQSRTINVWNWDYVNLRARQDVYVDLFGDYRLTVVNLLRYDKRLVYTVAYVFDNPVSCSKNVPSDNMKPWGIDSRYKLVGNTTINGQPVSHYSWGSSPHWDAYVTVTPPLALLRESNTQGGLPDSETNYTYLKFGPPPDSAFEPQAAWKC